MKIELLDNIFSKDIFTHRICKIRYSYAFENYLRDKLSLLQKEFNVYTIDNLFGESSKNSANKSKLLDWLLGLAKNLLGLEPTYGMVFTIFFSVADTISFLKMSDLEKLREHLQLKEKPHKKYRKLKNILVIKNCSYLNKEEIKKVHFIKELIIKKYILNTLLIICEPLDLPSNLVVNNDAVYTIELDNDFLNTICGFRVEDNYLKLINVLGIEYAEYITNLDTSTAGLSTLFQTNFFRLFFRYCTGV